MTIEQLGQQMKQQYPQYQNMSDAELGNLVLQKYPEYQSMIKKPGLVQGLAQAMAKPFLRTAVTGRQAVAGLAALASGDKQKVADVLNKKEFDFGYLGSVKPVGGRREEDITIGQQFKTFAKDVVGTGLDLGSTLYTGGGAYKGASQLLKHQLKAAVKTGAKTGAISGALYGAGTALQEGESVGKAIGQGVGSGILGAAGGAVFGSAAVGAKVAMSPFRTILQNIAPTLEKMAIKVENTITKATKRDIQQGFKAENIFKYDLGGSIQKSLIKTEDKISQLVGNAEKLRSEATQKIDLNKVIQDVLDDLGKSKDINFAVQDRINRQLKSLISGLEGISGDGKLDVVSAQKVKVALGKLGSWINGQRDLDSSAMEVVANSMYTSVKKAIEKAVPDGDVLARINKELSELIPIQNVLIKRIPIAERNAQLSLTDLMTGAAGIVEPKAWGLFMLNRLQKSGRFADWLWKGTQKLKSGAEAGQKIQQKLKEQLKNYKPGLSIEDVSLKAKGEILKTTPKTPLVSKTEQSLIKEAKKYKTADEFVKAQGTDKMLPTFQQDLKQWKRLTDMPEWAIKDELGYIPKELRVYHYGKSEPTRGSFWSSDQYHAESFKKSGDKLFSRTIPAEDLKVMGEGRIIGKNRLNPKSNGTEFIYDPIKKTEIELKLTDIWNKAQKLLPKTPLVSKTEQSLIKEIKEFPRITGLSKSDSIVQEKAIEKFVRNKDKMPKEYIAKFGNTANADQARTLFEDVGYNYSNSAAAHEASSKLNKKVWEIINKNFTNREAVIFSGGSGAGKSSVAEKFVESLKNQSTPLLDGNLSSLKSANDAIKVALKNQNTPNLIYIYREPLDAFLGTIKRMLTNKAEKGRVVPISITASNHPGSLNVIKQLYKDYGKFIKDGKVKFTFINNDNGVGNATLMKFSDVEKIKMPENLQAKMIEMIKKINKEGIVIDGKKYKLTPDQYNQLIK